MNLSLVYSGIIHLFLFAALFFALGPSSARSKAVYTIDFIGQSMQTPARYGVKEESAQSAQAAKEAAKSAAAKDVKTEIPAPVKEEKKPAQYNAKEQISKKPVKAKPAPKAEVKQEAQKPAEEEKIVLSKPSILKNVDAKNIDPGATQALGVDGAGNLVKASFSNFPYPWYITQVRNSLWREWQKRMPKVTGLATLVSFSVDKYGVVYGIMIEKSSGDDTYDYAATLAASNSSPYPPLPQDFGKDTLTVTVEFKNE